MSTKDYKIKQKNIIYTGHQGIIYTIFLQDFLQGLEKL